MPMIRGRPLEFDPAAALEAAMETFWDLGYARGSLGALLERTGLSKSSLYQTFGSKDELFSRSLEHYVETRLAPLHYQLETSRSARTFLEAFVRSVADETKGSRRGCFLMNTAESMPEEPLQQQIVQRALKELERALAAAVKRAQQEGDIDSEESPRDTARYLIAALSGLKMLVKSGASQAAVRRAADIALRGIFERE